MVKILSWNARGLNAPNKQKEVKLLYNSEQVGLVGLLKTKIKRNKIDMITGKMFGGWRNVTNLEKYYNGRIVVTWRPDYYNMVVVCKTPQSITCKVVYIPLQMTFVVTFVYAFNTKEERIGLWSSLVGYQCWLS